MGLFLDIGSHSFNPEEEIRKNHPGLDELDYQEVLHPGIAKLYFSGFEKLPKSRTKSNDIHMGNSAIMLTYARFKKEILSEILIPLQSVIHIQSTDTHYPHGEKRIYHPIEIEDYKNRITRLIRRISPQIEDTHDHIIKNSLQNALISLVEEQINSFYEAQPKTTTLRKKVSNFAKKLTASN